MSFPSRERVDWIPVDKLPNILLEILRYSSEQSDPTESVSGTQVYHVVNPSSTSWSKLAPEALSCYPYNIEIRPVPFEEWVEILKNVTETVFADTGKIPAAKLLDFFKRAVHDSADSRMLSSIQAQKASPLLRIVGCVDALWVNNWMRQWGIISGGSSEASFESEESFGSGSRSGFLRLN